MVFVMSVCEKHKCTIGHNKTTQSGFSFNIMKPIRHLGDEEASAWLMKRQLRFVLVHRSAHQTTETQQ